MIMDNPKIVLRPVTSADGDYAAIEGLLVRAFPESERRDLDAQRHNVDDPGVPVTCYGAYAEGRDGLAGFITVWDMGGYRYIEHLATAEAVRNGGIGGAIVDAVMRTVPATPLVLEAEPEGSGEMARRRMAFYERHGLRAWRGYDYLQPPYRPGGERVPLVLMATQGLDAAADFARVAADLARRVYPPQQPLN